MKPHKTWKVLPHGDIEELAENLYTVVGKLRMPFGETPRRMTLVRLSDNRLAIYSAIALDDSRMAQLEALGRPTFLIVPSAIHRLDAHPWKERYPDITVFAPENACVKVSEIVAVDDTQFDLGDPTVRVEHVPGTKRRELSMLVETPTGKTLVINDLIFNLPDMKGIAGFGLRMLGFGPGHPTMPRLVKRKLVDDEEKVKAQLRKWADLDLERVLVSHGAPLEHPRETLLKLAAA